MKLESGNLKDLVIVAQSIIKHSYNKKIVLLNGEMGVGKTTLVKEIAKLLGVEENVSSPTFSIVNEYHGNEGHLKVSDPGYVVEGSNLYIKTMQEKNS